MIIIRFNKEDKTSIAYDDNSRIGICQYIEQGNYWNIVITKVNKFYQGQGIAQRLVETIIENANKYQKNVIADCSYAKKIIEKRR